MKVNEFFSILEKEVAPVSLSAQMCEKTGMHDNSGIIIDSGNKVKGALFTLDFSPLALAKTKLAGFNLMVTHHPAIFFGVKRVDVPHDPFAASLADCLKNGISVISMHLNFDCAVHGIDYHLMRGLGGEAAEATQIVLSHGGYGRVYNVEPQTFESFSRKACAEFLTDRCRFYDAGRGVKKIASFCGSGADEKSIAFAAANGADTFVSSDIKHHNITALLDLGINVVAMTHYCSEVYGLQRIYDGIKDKLGVPSAFFTDVRLL